MTASELTRRIMNGELLLIGEFRGGQAVRSDCCDKKSGLKIPRLHLVYAVECALGGALGVVKISGAGPDGVTEPEQITIPLKKGKRYAFPVQTVSKDRDVVTAWIGRAEPVPVEED